MPAAGPARGHLLREDERDLLGQWLGEPMDMYEVSSVKRGSELFLRSLAGGPRRVGQRDRLFSLSVRRLRRAEAEEGKDTTMLPDPGELRRRLGIPAGSRRTVT